MSYRLVDAIPERLEEGVLYLSQRYATASHLCACGCGTEVVTALGNSGWRLRIQDSGVSMWPSVGNWSFACRSHYIIDRGVIRWAGNFSRDMIDQVRRSDNPRAHRDIERRAVKPDWRDRLRSRWHRLLSWLNSRWPKRGLAEGSRAAEPKHSVPERHENRGVR